MPKSISDPLPEEIVGSPMFWLAVVRAARTARDAILESLARRRLAALGARVIFDSEYRLSEQSEGGSTNE